MKTKFSFFLKKKFKFENKIIGYFLAVLGFSAGCIGAAEYGMPYAQLTVNGKVTSSTTKQPIENIQVVLNEYDTTSTDSNGFYTYTFSTFPDNEIFINLNFNDIDSIQNGFFENKDMKITTTNEGFENGDGKWYEGEKSIIEDVELDEMQ